MDSSRFRTCSLVALAAGSVALAGCGSGGSTAASRPQPPNPIVLSALVSDSRVAVSPARIGAGPVLLTITNQGTRSYALVLSRAGRARAVARTAPINPQGTTQLPVSLDSGRYTLGLAGARARDLAGARTQAPDATIAKLRVGARRSGGGGTLLSP